MGGQAAAKEANRRRAAEMKAAKQQFSATQDSVNLMKLAGRESLFNASEEVLRAGAESSREVRSQIQVAVSQSLASSEGITSGRSKGRQMMVLAQKGAEAVHDSKTEASNVLGQMVDAQDKQTNDLNNRLLSAHQELTAVLSTPGQVYQQNVAALVSSGISGAAQGFSLGKSIGAASAGAATTK